MALCYRHGGGGAGRGTERRPTPLPPPRQTRECVSVILKAEVPVVVAITKADLVDATKAPGVIGRQLLELGLATEEFGGDAPVVAVSAKARGARGE